MSSALPRVATPQRPVARSAAAGAAAPSDSIQTRGLCFTPDGQAVYLPENGESLTLGRESKNSLVFQQDDVSRRHAEIVEKDGKHYLRDLGSSNGTYLNGQLIEKGKWVEFSQGDHLRLGSQASLSRSPTDLPEQLPALPLPVQGAAVTVGRGLDNSLITPWPNSSRSHAVIQEKDGVNWLLDKGSSNGTFLNGKKIPSQQWVILQPGQVVQFGPSPGAAFLTQPPAPPTQPGTILGNQTGATASQPDKNASAPAIEKPERSHAQANQVFAKGVDGPVSHPARAISTIDSVSGSQAADILQRAQFAPNPTGIRAMGAPDCTREFLEAQGLEPRLTFDCGDQKVHFSRPYTLGEGRAACVGYVEDKNGEVKVRAFYRSNSQGLWRSASHAGFQGWVGKGQGEESTNLPIELQQHLHAQAESTLKQLDESAAHQAFYGSLEFGGKAPPTELSSQLRPAREMGDFSLGLPGGKYGVPESFALLDPSDGPNFQSPGVSYGFQHPLHGHVTASLFPSKNGQLQYLFYQDQQSRTWIAQVEDKDSALTSWGTRQTPVHTGDLSMPAIEYPQQIPPGYAGTMVSDDYADASAYVHRLPPVQEFRQHLGLK